MPATETPLQRVERLRQERAGVIDAMQEIADRATREGDRDLRPDEAKKFTRLERRCDDLTDEIKRLEDERGFGRSRLTKAAVQPQPGLRRIDDFGGGAARTAAPKLSREQRMRDWTGDHAPPSEFTLEDADDFSLGNIMRALVQPAFRDQLSGVEKRVLAEGVDATGGFGRRRSSPRTSSTGSATRWR